MSGGNPAKRALSEDDIRKLLRDAVKDTVLVNHICSCGKYHKVRVLDKQREDVPIAVDFRDGGPGVIG